MKILAAMSGGISLTIILEASEARLKEFPLGLSRIHIPIGSQNSLDPSFR